MTDFFLGEIKLTPYNFAPFRWANCSGQLLSISQNTALFSLLGTFYGGNGQTTFALPDLRSRAVQGVGTSTSTGQTDGTESVTVLSTQYPQHTHQMKVNTAAGGLGVPTNNFLSQVTPNANSTGKIYAAPGALQPLNPATLGIYAGGSVPHENRQPHLALNYIIALSGIFPARN
ncbi:MAG TPA: tail fiber protein [Caulobacteraceae bacterium]|jgi:microcystin-dependent protein|nr:tail fiber protein [Caulobacteraceae bacterium]